MTQTATKDDERQGRDAEFDRAGRRAALNVLIVDADARETLLVARCLAASGAVALYGVGEKIGPVVRYGRSFRDTLELGEGLDRAAWFAAVRKVAARWRIDVALPIGDKGFRMLADCARGDLPASVALPPSPAMSAIATVSDKRSLAAFLRAHDLPHPPTWTPGVDDPQALAALPAPFLLKPACSYGGVGIERLRDVDAVMTRIAGRETKQGVVVQSEIDGTDFGVNVLCRDGAILAATVQKAIAPSKVPFEFALGVEFVDEPELLEIAAHLVRALDWSGVANIDVRREASTDRFLILEFNGRYWGSLLSSLAAGVNFPLLACRLALGEALQPAKPRLVRHFRGIGPVLATLSGGGRRRIRLRETDWRYYRGDLASIGVWIAVSLWRAVTAGRKPPAGDR